MVANHSLTSVATAASLNAAPSPWASSWAGSTATGGCDGGMPAGVSPLGGTKTSSATVPTPAPTFEFKSRTCVSNWAMASSQATRLKRPRRQAVLSTGRRGAPELASQGSAKLRRASAACAEGLLCGLRSSNSCTQAAAASEICAQGLRYLGPCNPSAIDSLIASAVKAAGWCGHSPKSRTYAVAPMAHMSTFALYASLFNISGAM
mmetsp:Transcript_97986/g.272646  ORF Transcript_97986/g.272646 Transcript_97986/m.272646 type:complete len:206 (+) Transcript_97986:527-1144(+)